MNSQLYRALMLISFVNYGISVPPEFCLYPLNKRDCKVPSRPVFSYYHPGSRCEIELWRGCPTRNLFYDEVTCSSVCIYNLYKNPHDGSRSRENVDGDTNGGIMLLKGTDRCNEPFQDGDCGKPKQTKYYFAGNTCVRTDWMGCKSNNLFDDLPACIRACNPVMYFEPKAKEALKGLDKEEVINVDKLINHAIQEEQKFTELPTIPAELPQNETNSMLMDLYNVTSEELDYTNYAGDVSYDNVGQYVETLSAEHPREPDKLAAVEDSVEGSLEEVFTLS